jgi:PAS domain-containing protein
VGPAVAPGAPGPREARRRSRPKTALRESEERLRALVTASVDVIWRTDAKGEVLFVSQSWEELTGQTPEQILNFGWLEAIHPTTVTAPGPYGGGGGGEAFVFE